MQPPPLMPLVKQHKDPHRNAIGFTLKDYLELVDWAGRDIREDKHGAISEEIQPILLRLGLEPSRYLEHVKGSAATEDATAIGNAKRLRETAEVLGKRFIKGVGMAKWLYSPTV